MEVLSVQNHHIQKQFSVIGSTKAKKGKLHFSEQYLHTYLIIKLGSERFKNILMYVKNLDYTKQCVQILKIFVA